MIIHSQDHYYMSKKKKKKKKKKKQGSKISQELQLTTPPKMKTIHL